MSFTPYASRVIKSPQKRIADEAAYLKQQKQELTIGAVADTYLPLRNQLHELRSNLGIGDPQQHWEYAVKSVEGIGTIKTHEQFVLDFLEHREFYQPPTLTNLPDDGRSVDESEQELIYAFAGFGDYDRQHFPDVKKYLDAHIITNFPPLYPYRTALFHYICYGIERGLVCRPFPFQIIHDTSTNPPRIGIEIERNILWEKAIRKFSPGKQQEARPWLLHYRKSGRAHDWENFIRQLHYYKLIKHDRLEPGVALSSLKHQGFSLAQFNNGKDTGRQLRTLDKTMTGAE